MKIDAAVGDEITSILPALADLRIRVFEAWPYLYRGDAAYERAYLGDFAAMTDAVVVVARDGEEIVGCSTGSAIGANHPEFSEPLEAAGYDLAATFYCGESVLLPAYRGRGIGHAFFDGREAHARAKGYARSCFCAVIRPDDHPLKPSDYRPLDPFWTARGYRRLDGAICWFTWRDVDKETEDAKPMAYWMRDL